MGHALQCDLTPGRCCMLSSSGLSACTQLHMDEWLGAKLKKRQEKGERRIETGRLRMVYRVAETAVAECYSLRQRIYTSQTSVVEVLNSSAGMLWSCLPCHPTQVPARPPSVLRYLECLGILPRRCLLRTCLDRVWLGPRMPAHYLHVCVCREITWG